MEFHSINEEIMEKHLQECLVNPENQSCVRCEHLKKHNEIIDGDMTKFYFCHKKDINKELDEADITMMDATCFEVRKDKKIPTINSKAYDEYCSNIVTKIQNKVGD